MLESVNLLVPGRRISVLEKLPVFNDNLYSIKFFDPLVVEFMDSLSKGILRNIKTKQEPSIAALGFWLRKSNLLNILKDNAHLLDSSKYKINPLGIILHICPSNVDTMFLYSMTLSVLAGNKNIVRLSSKSINEHLEILIDLINDLLHLEKFSSIKNYLNIITYEHNEDLNNFFSAKVDGRIIWGGDSTVELFKTFKTKIRSKDLFFPDRISYSIFNANAFLKSKKEDQEDVVKKFYNDSYVFDQKGCSSPQIIFILSNEIEYYNDFKKSFYTILSEYASRNYNNDLFSIASLKIGHLSKEILDNPINVNSIKRDNNFLYFIDIKNQPMQVNSCGGGYFYICHLKKISELEAYINKHVQTLTFFGLNSSELEEILELSLGKGIDRIVPVGKALNFEYIWDGYNLIDELCSKKRIIIS